MAAADRLPAALASAWQRRFIPLTSLPVAPERLGALLHPAFHELARRYLDKEPEVEPNSHVRSIVLDRADAYLPFHQDQTILNRRLLNVWIPLDPCGVDAPGLEVVWGSWNEVIEPAPELDAQFPVERARLDPEAVDRRFGAASYWHPQCVPGDAMLFSGATVHRTFVTPEMTRGSHERRDPVAVKGARANRRDAVLVVGMGRSGTSALTRVIAFCGGALPRRVLPANFANPTGYWEPQLAVEINDAFLFAHSSSWYDAGLTLQLDPPHAAVCHALVARITEFLESGFDDDGPIVLKEPRISGLLPYWTLAASGLGFTAKFIHIFRSPADVAFSLAVRDGLPTEDSFALWLKYNLLAERASRRAPRIFVSYEDLMRDWESVAARCIGELQIDAAIGDETRASVARFLSPNLHHHRAATAETAAIDPALVEWVQRVYEVLLNARSEPIRTGTLDAIFAGYAKSRYDEDRPGRYRREA